MIDIERPVREPDSIPDGGIAARRAVIRWGLRLFRREWRQQILIVVLIAVATAAMIIGTAVATATPGTPNAGTYGTAKTLIVLPGTTRDISGFIAKAGKAYGPVGVIDDQTLVTGMAQGADLRAQSPSAPYTRPLLALVSGHYPAAVGQTAVTAGLAQLYGLRAGGTWRVPGGQTYLVTGIVENPSNLLDEFALVPPGGVAHPSQVRLLLGVYPNETTHMVTLPPGAVVQQPTPSGGIDPAAVVLIVSVLGLVFIGLVAAAGFTVMAQRRIRALGMLSSLGATEDNVRLVMVAGGAAAGVVGALVGIVLGFAAWFWYYPHLETDTAHRIDPLALPWWAVIIGVLLAIGTSVLAAAWPARAVSQVPIVAAISGRVSPPRMVTRSMLPGLAFLGGGLLCLYSTGGWSGGPLLVLVGLVACVIAMSLLAPLCVAVLARLGRHAPVATRLALRDLVRYRSRSGSALAAVAFAVYLAVLICIIASVRFGDVLDWTGANLTSSQLIVYTPDNDPSQYQQGQLTPPAKLAAVRSEVNGLATALHATGVLTLEVPVSLNVPQQGGPPQNQPAGLVHFGGPGPGNFSGQIYIATPQLLNAFTINPSQVAPDTDILTMRPGLSGVSNLFLVAGRYFNQASAGCSPGMCIANPVIQTFGTLPSGTDAPNTLITERAVRALRQTVVTVGWMLQTPAPLTSAQIEAARQAALATGATVQTKSGELGLSQISQGATLLGIAIALGVLAMTVGLIRSETAADLRTLTAAGVSGRSRRALTGVTAGALALLGAVLGTAVACLAGLAWAHSSLTLTFGNVSPLVFLLLMVGMPLIAAIAGWLLGGREPRAFARQPLE